MQARRHAPVSGGIHDQDAKRGYEDNREPAGPIWRPRGVRVQLRTKPPAQTARGLAKNSARRSKQGAMKDVKARQSAKIREIGAALVAMGYLALDEQARALGLGRSTAWTILQANHKNSGLSATVIIRMLAAPKLPPLVRAIILEYVDEKVAGLYGHSKLQLRRFAARLTEQSLSHTRTKVAA